MPDKTEHRNESTQQLVIQIIDFTRQRTDNGLQAVAALAGAVIVLAVRGGIDSKQLFRSMRDDYRALVSRKNKLSSLTEEQAQPTQNKGDTRDG
jgi:hypothetical protein